MKSVASLIVDAQNLKLHHNKHLLIGNSLSNSFQRTLDHIRSIADSEAHKGRLFERLMKTYFVEDPLYKERFSHVWLWSDWAALQPGFDGTDTGIDLVAEERSGGHCAIQCKCYAPGTRISKPHLDSFISASARDPFTARIVVDTGDRWGRTALKTLAPLKPACAVLRFGDLASRPRVSFMNDNILYHARSTPLPPLPGRP